MGHRCTAKPVLCSAFIHLVKREKTWAEEKCLTHTRVCVYTRSLSGNSPPSSFVLANGVGMMLVLKSKKISLYMLVAQNRNKSSQSADRFCC